MIEGSVGVAVPGCSTSLARRRQAWPSLLHQKEGWVRKSLEADWTETRGLVCELRGSLEAESPKVA